MTVLRVLLRSLIIETAMDKFLTNVWWNLCARPAIQASTSDWMEELRMEMDKEIIAAIQSFATLHGYGNATWRRKGEPPIDIKVKSIKVNPQTTRAR